MDNNQLTQAFDDAYTEYTSVPFRTVDKQAASYFFFAGSEFGLQQASRIYGEAYQRPERGEEVVGEPV